MKTSELLLWMSFGTMIIVISSITSYFKYKYRTQQLKYVQEHTDDKTFANYLFYRQIYGLFVFILIFGYLAYMSKINRKI